MTKEVLNAFWTKIRSLLKVSNTKNILTWGQSITIATIDGNEIKATMPQQPEDTHYKTKIYAGDGSNKNVETENGHTYIVVHDEDKNGASEFPTGEKISIQGCGEGDVVVYSKTNGEIMIGLDRQGLTLTKKDVDDENKELKLISGALLSQMIKEAAGEGGGGIPYDGEIDEGDYQPEDFMRGTVLYNRDFDEYQYPDSDDKWRRIMTWGGIVSGKTGAHNTPVFPQIHDYPDHALIYHTATQRFYYNTPDGWMPLLTTEDVVPFLSGNGITPHDGKNILFWNERNETYQVYSKKEDAYKNILTETDKDEINEGVKTAIETAKEKKVTSISPTSPTINSSHMTYDVITLEHKSNLIGNSTGDSDISLSIAADALEEGKELIVLINHSQNNAATRRNLTIKNGSKVSTIVHKNGGGTYQLPLAGVIKISVIRVGSDVFVVPIFEEE